MRLICLYSAMPNYDLGLKKSVTTMNKVFEELDVIVDEINIYDLFLPYYNGETVPALEELIHKIDKANGIIMACTSSMDAPCGVMQTFIEHLQHVPNKKFLQNKNCLLMTVSENNSQRNTLGYLSDIVNYFKGFDSVRIALTKGIIDEFNYNPECRDIFEKQVEDFYRILRQNRRYFIIEKTNVSLENKKAVVKNSTKPAYKDIDINENNSISETVNVIQKDEIQETDEIQKTGETQENHEMITEISAEELSQKLNLVSEKQEEDIKEISSFFATKFKPNKDGAIIKEEDDFYFDVIDEKSDVQPRGKTTKQITQSLPHYFKINFAKNADFKMQLYITGEEEFNGYISIENSTCDFIEGEFEKVDIVVYAKDDIWRDIITGKKTAQKSFMTGQLKVKGNFVLLTKFDQLFEFIK